MPFISDTASAIKSRFGFHDHSSLDSTPSVRSTPTILKSASEENLAQSSSVVRSISNWDGDEGGTSSSIGPSSQSFDFCEDPSFWKDHNVQVIIRIRPVSTTEISLQGYRKCVRQESCQTITWTGHPESRFTFDIVADEHVSQEKLFKVAGLPMVENCMGGYNSCMFAYGQTGSGKTHTMLGDIEGGTRRHSVNSGMTPRVFEHLFSRIQKEKEARRDEKLRFTCRCSFLEIYNEQILDLLDPSSNNLQIREDIKKGVYVENLKETEVTSARDVIQLLIQGAANRKVAATNMNHASSRSHSVFTCIIESKWESQGVTHHRFAQLNLVDLAGSERQKSSGAEGERLKEATNINKSLSTLGLVIMNLVSLSNGKSLHVPYRDSKLTFLLQDSLGGNSKTTIIANISPSSCCSLETLSTLKFAQRAKFIKNNAMVNEDASGDVIAMRMQIQQLKKEVSRLRGLVSGSEKQDNDTFAESFPGSPGSFKWEGLYGSSSPLASGKRMSRKKDYEVALVGAFRREKDKDIALRALTAENQAAVQLAKQREDEIQGLKMRLGFREAAIKRLEAVASGKIKAETHLLKEKEEHLKEIEILRAQVDRNQEVTRFAMENLRLKEEIRRLKSFYEEGERDMMNEQILVLQNKLLEALDWKLMHESDPIIVQKEVSDVVMEEVQGDGNLLISNQEGGSARRSSISEENEFLRMQAIHNQAEMDTLHKELEFCIEEKEKMERHVNDLVVKLEEERTSRATKEGTLQVELPSLSTNASIINLNDQMELKTMVDAIAAASQREAEAHETAIMLSKENDELRMKLKVLIEDNNKLIELYERAAAESNYKSTYKAERAEGGIEVHNSDSFTELVKEKETGMKEVVENLEHQLIEINEENEKLLGLYEKAMQERDEFKRMLSCGQRRAENKLEFDCPEKLVEVGVDHIESGEPPMSLEARDLIVETALPDLSLQDRSHAFEKPNISGGVEVLRAESDFAELDLQVGSSQGFGNSQIMIENQTDSSCLSDGPPCVRENTSVEESTELVEPIISCEIKISDEDTVMSDLHPLDCHADSANPTNVGSLSYMETDPSNLSSAKLSDLNLVRMKLARADEQLLDSAKSITMLRSLEKQISEVEKLSKKVEEMKDGLEDKRQQHESLKLTTAEMKERRARTDKKLSALKYSLASFSSSLVYFDQREARARSRVTALTSYLDRKKDELACLQTQKDEIEKAHRKIKQTEFELRNNLACLRTKLEEENRKQENEKVLFATENIEKIDPSQKLWHLGGKATELLKSEEEKTKLQTEMKLSLEKLGDMRRESDDLKSKHEKLDSEMQAAQAEMEKLLLSVEEKELALQGVIQEKATLLEIRENGKTEIEKMILEYQQHVFEADLKESETRIIEEEIQTELRRIEELGTARSTATEEITQLLEGPWCNSCCLSEKMKEELRSVRASVIEAKSLLGEGK
ncbi:kinesin-like protein KIN-12E [Juglans microcarpa x Juglans regia]|uniref:kinesin-like protein KIN-12E n=1 Tax=Juglans microcarpa x Juglans regia TaxID=2249226 RepID=UPI001B7EBA4C|nr:kinesin-like protein KIN-12E [Juglans microcarpa x Juglans regia]